ncbi:putative Dolichyl-phosphate beta-glucosyltransferase [Paratrimastix pyriformis]|uniref:Dolichyl-phosphate beta-glucosyltransferase n=1 Tax=Paratrimastix pyriformis TaxID=342808 RepID=A0ABQ8UEY8_9EUKA|nr:putative Dolichyl-phosphate beta-glucosyltransferase [Paratrimastix pyriformis]
MPACELPHFYITCSIRHHSSSSAHLTLERSNTTPTPPAERCLLIWGDNSHGQVGVDNTFNEIVLRPQKVPIPVGAGPVISIACGARHTAVVTRPLTLVKAIKIPPLEEGRVWVCGAAGPHLGIGVTGGSHIFNLTQVPGLEDAKQVVCGTDHTVVVTNHGAVYTWGDGGNGKLGHGGVCAYERAPRLVEALSGLHIMGASCGNAHTIAVTAEGDLFSWGGGDYGKLGHGDVMRRAVPTPVRSLRNVRQISAGGSHTACIVDGILHTWGRGFDGRLGHQECTAEHTPRRVDALLTARVVGVSCGGKHTACVTEDKELFTFGDNHSGQLGSGDARSCGIPIAVTLPSSAIKADCGFNHTTACSADGRVFAFGWNTRGALGVGDTADRYRPTKVLGVRRPTTMACGAGSTAMFAGVCCDPTLFIPTSATAGSFVYVYLRRFARKFSSHCEKEMRDELMSTELFQSSTISLSIVIPAYNEEKRLLPTLSKIAKYVHEKRSTTPGWSVEVLVVDDGSKDQTSAVATKSGQDLDLNLRVITVRPNQGKGNAIREGMLHSRGEVMLMMDADGAHDIYDVDRLIGKLPLGQSRGGVSAVVIGTRDTNDATVKRTIPRKIFAFFFHLWVSLFCVRGIRDTQNGFKLFTRASARLLFPNQHLTRWAFDIELLFLTQRVFGMKIYQERVSFTDVAGSKLGLISASLTMARDVALVWALYTTHLWRITRRFGGFACATAVATTAPNDSSEGPGKTEN